MNEVTDKELSEMIADLMHTDDNWPDRKRLCLALIELQSVRKTAEFLQKR